LLVQALKILGGVVYLVLVVLKDLRELLLGKIAGDLYSVQDTTILTSVLQFFALQLRSIPSLTAQAHWSSYSNSFPVP
jgi:hypothetical protein